MGKSCWEPNKFSVLLCALSKRAGEKERARKCRACVGVRARASMFVSMRVYDGLLAPKEENCPK